MPPAIIVVSRALKICRDRQGAGGKDDLQFIRQQRLHRRCTAFQSEILSIEAVLLKNLFLVRRPDHGMNRGRKTAAGDAEFVLRGALAGAGP